MGTLFIIASNIFAVLMPKVVDDAIDLVENNLKKVDGAVDSSHLFESLWMDALMLGGAYILFAIIKGIFLFFQR